MNRNQVLRISIGVVLLCIGYYFSTPTFVLSGFKYSILLGLLKVNKMFPLDTILPATLLLGGLGILLRLVIKSKWIVLALLLIVGFLLTKFWSYLPIGYIMLPGKRGFYLVGLGFFLLVFQEIDERLRKRESI